MRDSYRAIPGVPIPETRGRKKGSGNRNSERQSAITKGVGLVVLGKSCVDAARMVQVDYPYVSLQRMTKLIRQARKEKDQNPST